MMTIRLFLFAGLFFLCFSEQASSDVVHLKNERNLTGKVVENNERFVRLELSGGTVEFPRSDVEWVLLGTEKEIEDQRRAAGFFDRGQSFFEKKDFEKAI